MFKKRKGLLLLAAVVAVVMLVLGSCAPAAAPTTPTPTPTPTTTPTPTPTPTPTLAPGPKGKVIIAMAGSTWAIKGGDLATSYSGSSVSPCNFIGDGLTGKDVNAKVIPAIASSWRVSEDGLSVDFTLRNDVKFHNGDPLTAKDVKFTIERYMRPEMKFWLGGESRLNYKSVEIVDDYHVIFHLNQRFAAFFDRPYEYIKILPKDYCERVGDEEFAKHPVAAGPFRWVKYQQDIFYEGEAVENHYRKTPEVKTMVLSYIPEASTRMAMLKTGEADIIALAPANIQEVEATPRLRIVVSRNTQVLQLVYCDMAFPATPSPFLDIRVRKAASYAIDREAICKKVLYGTGTPYKGSIAPYMVGYDAEFANAFDPYDPKKAKELLTEAGYPNGFDTRLTIPNTEKTLGEAYCAYLAEVGIKAKLNLLENLTWQNIMGNTHSETGLIYHQVVWNARSHPASAIQSQYSPNSGWNYFSKTAPAELGERFFQLAATDLGNPELANMVREFDEYNASLYQRMEMYALHSPYALGPRIEYYVPMQGLTFTQLEYLRLKPEAK